MGLFILLTHAHWTSNIKSSLEGEIVDAVQFTEGDSGEWGPLEQVVLIILDESFTSNQLKPLGFKFGSCTLFQTMNRRLVKVKIKYKY